MRAKGEQKKPYRKLTGTSKHAIARCEPVRLDQRLSKTLDFFGIRFTNYFSVRGADCL
jgi:hypothetical protein